MKTMSVKEFYAAFKAQGAIDAFDACVVCPMCGTVQNGRDFVAAGAAKTLDDIGGLLGSSCIGRQTHHLPPPKEKGTQIGCNWALWGFLQLHDLEVIDEDGQKFPMFEPATPEQAKAHCIPQLLNMVEKDIEA